MEKDEEQDAILRRVYLTKDLYIQIYTSTCVLRTAKGHCVLAVNGDENAVLAHQCFGSCGQFVNPRQPIREMLIADNHCVLESGGKIHLCHGECSRHPGATHQVLLYGLYGGGPRYMMRTMRKLDPRYDEDDRISADEFVKKKLAYFATLKNVKEPETRKELIAKCNELYEIKDDTSNFVEYRAFSKLCVEENLAARNKCCDDDNLSVSAEEDAMPDLLIKEEPIEPQPLGDDDDDDEDRTKKDAYFKEMLAYLEKNEIGGNAKLPETL